MNVLVSGANGFLGRHVVSALLARGHFVRALVRPHADATRLPDPAGRCELFRADLRASDQLPEAFRDIDVLVHLAAQVMGDDEGRFASTVVGTERLLDAMAAAGGCRRLVLAGSVATYNWESAGRTLTETSPIMGDGDSPQARRKLYARDGYAVAKVWQERVARRAAAAHGWDLTVLRPGIIWGPGNTDLGAVIGPAVGPFQVVFGPTRDLPLTHVENCAEAFALAAEDPRAAGQTFNVTDDAGTTAWRYAGIHRQMTGGGIRVPVPSAVGLLIARAAALASRIVFGPAGKLPGILVPARYQARFRCVRVAGSAIRDRLGWRPRLTFDEAAARSFTTSRAGRIAESPQPGA